MLFLLYYFMSSLIVYFTQDYLTRYIAREYTFTLEKASYVACNFVKSAILCIVVVSPLWYKTLFEFDPTTCRFLAVSYGITDFTALIQNKRMMWSTIAHHVMTTLVSLYFAVTPTLTPSMGSVVWYGLWSAFAYPVNTYLGLRKIGKHPRFKSFAFYVYLIACLFNWVYQLWFFLTLTDWNWQPILWLLIMIVLIRDDVILLRVLSQDSIFDGSRTNFVA